MHLRDASSATPDPVVPRHVAIVMDGNGRWAKRRFLPRFFGHEQGVDALVAVMACADRGVEHLTVFAFSSEKLEAPTEEVSGLMGLVLVGVDKYLAKLATRACASASSATAAVDRQAAPGLDRAESATRDNTRITLWVAFAYGGRWDVVQACQQAMRDGIDPAQLDEATLGRYMAFGDAPDPDLLIRTGGELRISNFLLWQLAYSELVFTDCLWPDFGETDLDAAISAFAARDRRFGLVKAAPVQATGT
ncbi:MAG: di-trans,poly-cis-decaprenylcistransferase [Piscinibacter sp.]|nr:di-trans,poly-cis-decaprenylcistransferase [Piscinibacter sp.]